MIGTSIGHYHIHSTLGSGGMGEVYRARDSRLGRDVALKILPEQFARDPERLARFRREAQVLASLNHANIAAIHGLEEVDGVPALVLELVEGVTLADRLVQGSLPRGEALAIARQIAEALEAAHEAGVVHRDLKPANVKLRPDATVKVLDFGLAKALDLSAPADSSRDSPVPFQPDRTASPTITSPALTRLGVILGTASYMSPEQARGIEVDRRADIWAWGCVLFEMLTGARAFDGADTTDVIAAVVRGEPNWSGLPADTPLALRLLLRRCLEKDRRRRLADIRDARFAIEDLAEESDQIGAPPSPVRERLMWAAALLMVIVGAAALSWRGGAGASAPGSEMHVEITMPATYDLVSFAVSPDREKLAFVAFAAGRPMLWLRSLATGEARALPGTAGASFPFWSPDSLSIGFFASERLYRVDIDGGSLRELADAPVGTGGTWSRDGVILFTPVPDSPIQRVADTGGTPALVPGSDQTRGQGGNRFPQFLPDGRRYFYFVAEAPMRGVHVGTLDGPERRHLFDSDAAAVVVPPTHVLFVRAGTLFLQPFDFERLTVNGSATQIATGISVDAWGAAAISAASLGTIAYRTGPANRQRQMIWFDRAGKQIGEAFPPDAAVPLNLALSPDGRRLALNRTVEGNVDIWLVDVERRGALTRLTTVPSPDISPVWSPDGGRITYAARDQDPFDIVEMPTSVAGERAVVFRGRLAEVPLDWSRDGRFLLYRSQVDPATGVDLWALELNGPLDKPIAIATTKADETSAVFSPNGKWVAFESNETGSDEVYVQTFPGGAGKTTVSTAGGLQPRWAPDGKELLYVARDGKLMSVTLRFSADGSEVTPGSPVPLFQTRVNTTRVGGSRQDYVVSSDGTRFLMNTLVEQSGLPITLILNRR